jgi:phage terminase large subunit-like protein
MLRGAAAVESFWDDLATEIELQRAAVALAAVPPGHWREWLSALFPRAVTKPFGTHHEKFWEWVYSIDTGRPRPFVGIWPRGGGKTSSAEIAVVNLGARRKRRYGAYVCSTQDKANDKIVTIQNKLESNSVGYYYPGFGSPRVGLHGSSKGWRRNRLWTAGGFVIDALGFDTAARGLKVDDDRPDLIILDDIDELTDSPAATLKKIAIMTKTILPIGATNAAILALQNLIIPNGIFGRMRPGRTADYLLDRIMSGPLQAIEGCKIERQEDDEDGRPVYQITAGTPIWAGQGIAECEDLIRTFGVKSFREEQQQDVDRPEGTLFERAWFVRLPEDPAVTAGEDVYLSQWRAWDLAATEGGGDNTAGAKAGKPRTGETVFRHVVKGKLGPRRVMQLIAGAMLVDGPTVGIRLPDDPAAGGKASADAIIRFLREVAAVVEMPCPRIETVKPGRGQGSEAAKRSRAQTLRQAAEPPGVGQEGSAKFVGTVWRSGVESAVTERLAVLYAKDAKSMPVWSQLVAKFPELDSVARLWEQYGNRAWQEDWLDEMEAFTGAEGGVDDQVDASVDAHDQLATARVHSGWRVPPPGRA